MKNNDMTNYMKQELWVDRVREIIAHWEIIKGVEVPKEIKDSIVGFMAGRINKGIEKNSLVKTFMQVAVTALIQIKMKKTDDY